MIFSLHPWCLRPSVCVTQVAPSLRPRCGTAAIWPAEEIVQVSSRTKIPLQIVSIIQKTVSDLENTLSDTSIPTGQGLESAHQRHFAVRRSNLSNSRRGSVIVTSTPDATQDLNLSNLFNPGEDYQFLAYADIQIRHPTGHESHLRLLLILHILYRSDKAHCCHSGSELYRCWSGKYSTPVHFSLSSLCQSKERHEYVGGRS